MPIEDNSIKRTFVKINDVWVPLLGADINSVLNIDSESNILSGTEEPNASLGINGDLYFKTSSVGVKNILGQYINTGYSGNNNSEYLLNFSFLKMQTSAYPTPFGARSSSSLAQNSSVVHCGDNGNQNTTYISWGNAEVRNAFSFGSQNMIGKQIFLELKSGFCAISIDGVKYTKTFTPGTVTETTPIGIFALLANSSLISGTETNEMIFYKLTIKENGNIIHNFVADKDDNGVACIFDEVTQEYKYVNTGTLEYINEGIIIAAYAKVNGTWQPLIGTDISNINLNNKPLLNYLNNIILNETNISITTESSMTASLDSTNHTLQVTWNSGSSIGIRYKPYFLIPSFVNSMHYKIETGSRSYDTSIRFAPGVGILPASVLPDLKNGVEYNADRNNSSFLQIAYTQQRESILEGSFDLSNITEDTVLCIFCAGWDVTFSEIIFS